MWRRTLLVIWPSWSHLELVNGKEAFLQVCAQLRKTGLTTQSTAEQVKLVDIILGSATPEKYEDIVSSVCPVAIAWNELELWMRAVQLSGAVRSIAHMRQENMLLATATFGFANLPARWVCAYLYFQ